MTTKCEAHVDTIVASALDIRSAELSDGAAIWQLASNSEALDTNSCYAYLLLSSHFADTCWVAYDGDQLAGFVAAYVPPQQPEVIFVWQIGVDAEYRGRGLGRKLLAQLVDHAAAGGACYLEATVTPGNEASQRLFRSLAQARGWKLTTADHFETHHFAGPEHERESLIRIGPFEE